MGGGDLISKARGSLIGCNDDLQHITAFVDQAAVSGGALLLSGEAGVGKTVLLDAAAAHAQAAGSRVLRAAGAEFEGTVSFAGLNQLLRPLLGQARGLSAAYRRALAVALGVREGSSPDQLMLSNAALALLVQATGAGPVLVVVDDLPWLDRASAVVLGVVARRLADSRVGFLAASRSGEDGCWRCFQRRSPTRPARHWPPSAASMRQSQRWGSTPTRFWVVRVGLAEPW